MQQKEICSGGLLQLVPFLVFFITFMSPMFLFSTRISPVFACVIAIFVSLFTFIKPMDINQKIQVFIEGSSRSNVIVICYIFIFTTAFSYVLKTIGGIDATVRIGFSIIPNFLVLPGFFVVIALFALAVGTSLGTTAAFLPIGLEAGKQIGVQPEFMAALVVSAAILGDNLSVISDTTIAATKMAGANMRKKFKANAILVLPAFLLTLAILTIINFRLETLPQAVPLAKAMPVDYLFLLPYVLIFGLAAYGMDVLVVVILAIFFTTGLGLLLGHFSLLDSTKFIIQGFANNEGNMVQMVVYTLCKSGLSYIVEYNGGINYILYKFNEFITGKGRAEIVIAAITFLINAAVAVAPVSIIIAGPITRRIAEKFSITPERAACLTDVSATLCQDIIPYGAPLMLAGSLAGVSPIAIVPYLYYQGFLFCVITISVMMTVLRDKRKSQSFVGGKTISKKDVLPESSEATKWL
jgi:Na+/H+ antiporter NhaC